MRKMIKYEDLFSGYMGEPCYTGDRVQVVRVVPTLHCMFGCACPTSDAKENHFCTVKLHYELIVF